MIRFACPKCESVLRADDEHAGSKLECPKCGQRVQAPAPQPKQPAPPSKTVLGRSIPDRVQGADTKVSSGASARVPIGNCPGCHTPLQVPPQAVGQWVECPKCSTGFASRPIEEVAANAEDNAMDSPQSSGKRHDEKYCHECGATIRARAVVCPKCGVKQPAIADDIDDAEEFSGGTNRIAAGIFGILMGGLGIHKFILGYTGTGLIMLLTTVLGSVLSLCLLVPIIGPMAMGLIGFIEGIIYLTKSDREFYRTYVVGKRPWF